MFIFAESCLYRLTKVEIRLTTVKDDCFPTMRKPAIYEPFKYYAKCCVHFLGSIVCMCVCDIFFYHKRWKTVHQWLPYDSGTSLHA